MEKGRKPKVIYPSDILERKREDVVEPPSTVVHAQNGIRGGTKKSCEDSPSDEGKEHHFVPLTRE